MFCNGMKRRGFTIIELIIVVTIMGILLTIGVVNLRGSQANGRDAERKVDVDTIALHLETYYTSGTDGSTTIGTYPSTIITSDVYSSVIASLRDIDVKSITSPGVDDPANSFTSATNNTQTKDGVMPKPYTSTDVINQYNYIYQPIQSDGTLCTTALQECRKFNLYYKLENATTDCPAPNNICMITSKNQ